MMKNCPTCKQDFQKPKTESVKAWNTRRVYCSRACYISWMKGKDLLAPNRFKGTVWNKGKQVLAIRGENHVHWKGGSGSLRHQEMARVEYKEWRQLVFIKDDYTCQVCDDRGVYLHADHIKPWSEFPELRLEVSNGRTLCVPCHYYVTFKRKMPLGSKWGMTRAVSQEA